MKRITLILVLLFCISGYSQKNFKKREILVVDAISISYDNLWLYIDIANNNPIHFQIWKGNKMVLNAKGQTSGQEFYTLEKGKYKFILLDCHGNNSKTKNFRI